MKNNIIEQELRREVKRMLPENMVAEIKQHNITPEKVNKNIKVITERPRKSFVPLVASLVASVVLCLAVFAPIIIEKHHEYTSWLAQQQQQQEQEQEDNNLDE